MAKTLAIVERLPGHTEVMGGFASLALELGYEPHLLFERADRFHMVDYFQTRLPIAPDHIHDWSYVTDPDAHFNVVLLNTSFAWLDYQPWLRHWDTHQRLIVVHHHPEDIELNPHGSSIYLTPAAGLEKWIFPLYGGPSSPVEVAASDGSTAADTSRGLPTLVCLGSFDGKDVLGARAYMSAGGRVVHYDRHPCHYFADHGTHYRQHIGLSGLEFTGALASRKRPMFLWLPIVSPSDYMVCRFTAALITAVDTNSIMVMPQRLRNLYGFPEAAVIPYESSVTEPRCLAKLQESPAKQQERQRQLQLWATEQWHKNLQVFKRLVEGESV